MIKRGACHCECCLDDAKSGRHAISARYSIRLGSGEDGLAQTVYLFMNKFTTSLTAAVDGGTGHGSRCTCPARARGRGVRGAGLDEYDGLARPGRVPRVAAGGPAMYRTCVFFVSWESCVRNTSRRWEGEALSAHVSGCSRSADPRSTMCILYVSRLACNSHITHRDI